MPIFRLASVGGYYNYTTSGSTSAATIYGYDAGSAYAVYANASAATGEWFYDYPYLRAASGARRVEAARPTAQILLDEADKRAEALLVENLTAEQAAQYRQLRRFDVVVGERRYRIRLGWAGNVDCVDERGRALERYCIHPVEAVPYADNLLAQKLMLEMDEAQFLRVANRTVLRVAA